MLICEFCLLYVAAWFSFFSVFVAWELETLISLQDKLLHHVHSALLFSTAPLSLSMSILPQKQKSKYILYTKTVVVKVTLNTSSTKAPSVVLTLLTSAVDSVIFLLYDFVLCCLEKVYTTDTTCFTKLHPTRHLSRGLSTNRSSAHSRLRNITGCGFIKLFTCDNLKIVRFD